MSGSLKSDGGSDSIDRAQGHPTPLVDHGAAGVLPAAASKAMGSETAPSSDDYSYPCLSIVEDRETC